MKKIIAFLLIAACTTAQAVTYESRNKAGGAIVLTLDTSKNCPEDNQRIGYSVSRTGRAIFGCWELIERRIFMTYSDGEVRIYEAGYFFQHGESPKKATPASSSDRM